ncbi:MAG: chemotaxis protein CheW [Rubrivivax sp.]
MNLRGAVVPVVDLGARLGGRPLTVAGAAASSRSRQPMHRPPLVAGVMVDAVFEVVDVDPAAGRQRAAAARHLRRAHDAHRRAAAARTPPWTCWTWHACCRRPN